MDETPQRLEADRDDQVVRKLPDPRLPSQKDVELHELTHLPYRNWCPVCVRCRGRDLDHRKSVDEERGMSEYAFDYCFPGDEFEFHLGVLVGRERTTGAYFATAVPRKGSSGRFAVDKALDFVHDVGDRASRIIIKTDQEPAIRTWARDFCDAREDGRTVLEESPVRSSGSNGRAERAVQSIEAQIRVLLLSLEQNLGFKIDAREPILTYLPEYAAHLLNRIEVGKDGKTAYERYKGKRVTVLGIHFGEKVLYKTRVLAKQNKLRPRWDYGIFVGVKTSSNEVWIATADKTIAARAVRRLPPEQRWGPDCVSWTRRTLWNRYKEDSGADGELPEGVPQVAAPELEPRGGVGSGCGQRWCGLHHQRAHPTRLLPQEVGRREARRHKRMRRLLIMVPGSGPTAPLRQVPRALPRPARGRGARAARRREAPGVRSARGGQEEKKGREEGGAEEEDGGGRPG